MAPRVTARGVFLCVWWGEGGRGKGGKEEGGG